jgi:hypothetical protein
MAVEWNSCTGQIYVLQEYSLHDRSDVLHIRSIEYHLTLRTKCPHCKQDAYSYIVYFKIFQMYSLK